MKSCFFGGECQSVENSNKTTHKCVISLTDWNSLNILSKKKQQKNTLPFSLFCITKK